MTGADAEAEAEADTAHDRLLNSQATGNQVHTNKDNGAFMKLKSTILLAGMSASGKTTLATVMGRPIFPTSAALKARKEVVEAGDKADNDFLFHLGTKLDHETPHWLVEAATDLGGHGVVVDAVRSEIQHRVWAENSTGGVIRVNVVCSPEEMERRHKLRGTTAPKYVPFLFDNPDYVWISDKAPVAVAAQSLRMMSGSGYADIVLGAQYGSEGKGKL